MTSLSSSLIRVNRLQIVIGLYGLILGLLVYLVSRPPEYTYFLSWGELQISLYNWLPNLFGWLGNILPAFLHPFSFSLLTAGVLCCGKRGVLIVCVSWFLVDFVFELGQEFSALTSRILPRTFAGVPILENAKDFFTRGTFDPLDLLSIGFGCFAAYLVLNLTLRHGKKWGPR